jgi:hypothetical protein
VWSVEMHQQFVNAVNTLGVDSEYWSFRHRSGLCGSMASVLHIQRHMMTGLPDMLKFSLRHSMQRLCQSASWT